MQLCIHPNLPKTLFAKIGGDVAIVKGRSISRFRGDRSQLVDMIAPLARVTTMLRPSLEADVMAALAEVA